MKFLGCSAIKLSQDWTHRDSITLLVAKMRVCCFGSPTIFMVTNVRKCQTEWINISDFFLNSGSILFLFWKNFVNKRKKSYQNFKKNQNILTLSVWHFLTFVTIKIVGERKQQTLLLATNEEIESRCIQSCNTMLSGS